jgi:acetyl-CoA acetyltransferase
METLHRVAQSIAVGAIECGMAVGIERMGRSLGGGSRNGAPKTHVTEFNKRLVEMNELQRNMAPDHFDNFSVPFPDFILDSNPITSMTQTAQNVAEVYNLSREEMDQFAVDSHRKTAEAYDKGIYKAEVVPLEVETPVFDDQGNWLPEERGKKIVFEQDEGLRRGTNMEGLSALQPVKGIVSYGNSELRITAGNSCPTNDGVSAAILMSEKKAKELGLEPLARSEASGDGARPGAGDEEGAAARGHHRRPDRPRRVQRGVRRTGAAFLQRTRDSAGEGERQRRLDRHRPPAGRDGRAAGVDGRA